MSEIKLTDKQEAFCREYIIDFNATQAAIRVGYSEDTAKQQGSRLLTNVDIQKRVAELIEARNERTGINADYVLRQAVKLHERCMQEIAPKTVRGNPVVMKTDDGELKAVFQFDATGAAKALEVIGKHVDVQAFRERIDAEVSNKLVVEFVEPENESK